MKNFIFVDRLHAVGANSLIRFRHRPSPLTFKTFATPYGWRPLIILDQELLARCEGCGSWCGFLHLRILRMMWKKCVGAKG